MLARASSSRGAPSSWPLNAVMARRPIAASTNSCAASPARRNCSLAWPTPGFLRPEQWQAQIQALIQRRARVLLYSSLPDDVVRAAHLTPCHDIGAAVAEIAPALAWQRPHRRAAARAAHHSVPGRARGKRADRLRGTGREPGWQRQCLVWGGILLVGLREEWSAAFAASGSRVPRPVRTQTAGRTAKLRV